jgi:hypothetical protein
MERFWGAKSKGDAFSPLGACLPSTLAQFFPISTIMSALSDIASIQVEY